MTLEQLSVFVQNRTGQLDAATRALRNADVNIRAMSLADTADFGVLRLVVDNASAGREALQKAGFTVGSTPVLAIQLEDRPGSLETVLEVFLSKNINVEYLYGYTQQPSQTATLIFRLDRMDEAADLLAARGFHVLGPGDIA